MEGVICGRKYCHVIHSYYDVSFGGPRHQRPWLAEPPVDTEVHEGRSVELRCRSEGEPAPEVSWLHLGSEVTERDPRIVVLPDGTLHIAEVRPDDHGPYECIARSPIGEIRSSPAKLRVIALQGPPPISECGVDKLQLW
ncbi:PXDN [Cordylochernes scorpioides]|uniref:PXDN n=1 Tax=Cordylochernes scorpioides TaxID=51811 RepID=A0ABY6K3G5_9ARAC|nr:PXDN [Cordylochernes scorpioides]